MDIMNIILYINVLLCILVHFKSFYLYYSKLLVECNEKKVNN